MIKNVLNMINSVMRIQIRALADLAVVLRGDFGGFGGFEDIFNTFFGGGRRRDPNAPRQGADLQYTMTLSFEEACFGKGNRY